MALLLGVMVISANDCSNDYISFKWEIDCLNHNCCCNDKSLRLEAGEKGDPISHVSVVQCSMTQKPSTNKPALEPQVTWLCDCSAVPNVERQILGIWRYHLFNMTPLL